MPWVVSFLISRPVAGSLAKLLPVEKPLMQPYLDKFDVAAEEGLTTLNWETNGDELEKTRRDEYIEGATAAVDIVDEYTCSMKANLDHANEIMERWTSKPLLERDKKPVELIEFDRVFKKAKSERYADIKEGGKEVERMLKDTNKMLRVSNASLDWHAYIDFINNIVVDGRVSPCFEVLRRLHAVDARRLQERRSWVVCFPILSEFGPNRDASRRETH